MADTQGNLDGNKNGVSWDGVASENRQVYSGFLDLTKWGIILVVVVLIGMAIFLV
jgi:hypothetical protein